MMSASKKRKAPLSLQDTYDSMKELIVRVKDSKLDGWGATLVDDLHRLAALAEQFTEQRSRSEQRAWFDMAEDLDREGVHLWNSSLLRQDDNIDQRPVIAALRLAGFRLIEAGLEQNPGIQSIIHVLQTASKAGATLSELGSHAAAASVLGCAAKYEDMLRKADDPQGIHQLVSARATVVYLSCRMEAAFREGNESVAEYMLDKITEYNDRFPKLLAHDHELLAWKLLQIGESILNSDSGQAKGSNAYRAVRWLQRAFSLVEKVDDKAIPGITELKHCILINLANAYFHSASHDAENLMRAEVTLNELLTPAPLEGNAKGRLDYLELCWMKWRVLKRRKVAEPVLLDAFIAILDNFKFTEENCAAVLHELKSFPDQHVFVTSLFQACVVRFLNATDNSGLPFLDRVLLPLIFHCAKDETHERAMSDLEAAFTAVVQAEYEVPEILAAACVALLWQYGDRHYRHKRWSQAAEWFMAGTHNAFQTVAASTRAKCYRKAALCYIEKGEYSKATTVTRRCSTNEAATHYLLLLAAVKQGLEDEGIAAVQGMVKAPDFNRDMLRLATQLSHESNMKTLLLKVLEEMLRSMKAQESGDTVVEGVTLTRCIIRLVQSVLSEPGSDAPGLIPTLLNHFGTASALARSAKLKGTLPMLTQDISWLWRTAYNCAIQGCSEWVDAEESLAKLFAISGELLELYIEAMPVEVDLDLRLNLVDILYAGIACRVFAIRRAVTNDIASMNERRRQVLADITSCKEKINAITSNFNIAPDSDAARLGSFLHVIRVFEVELLAELKEWARVAEMTEQMIHSEASLLSTFEAIASILWSQTDCPVDVLLSASEAILHTSLDREFFSLEKFSRWLRGVCTMLLCRNSAADRAKAVGYVEQAITVMRENEDSLENSDDAYPSDERHWLLATSYNTGIECLHTCLLDEAKRWFEAATSICRFVSDGEKRAEKLSKTYTDLLSRYTPN